MTIRRVSSLSTGTVRIRPQHVESDGTPPMWWLNTSRRWSTPRPINVYVVEHARGLVLFDTGQDRRSVTDPTYFPRGFAGHLYKRLAQFDIPVEATLTERLAQLGYDIGDVRVAVLSHLHQDHIGGLAELGGAEIIVSADEFAEIGKPGAVLAGILERHLMLPGLDWHPVRLEADEDPSIAPFAHSYDLFGDRSLMLVPTPGHTRGSVSLLLRDPALPPMLFVGDLTYDAQLLAGERVPGIGEAKRLRASSRLVNRFVASNPGTLVLAAHDPQAPSLLKRSISGMRA